MFRFKDLFKNPILQSQLDKANEVGATLAIELRKYINNLKEIIKKTEKENRQLRGAVKSLTSMDRFKDLYLDDELKIRKKV